VIPRILIIGGGSGLQPRLRRTSPHVSTAVICRASVLGWVHQLEENQAVVVLHDDSPLKAWLAAARHLHEEWPIDAIASLAEIDQDKAAAIALDLGIPFHSPETVAKVHDKVAMRTALNESGVESVPFAQVASVGELEDFFIEHGAPLLLKPAKGRASAGVTVVRSRADLEDAFQFTLDAKAPRLEASLPIVERYVEGPEFSVEAITHDGVHYIFAITEKFKDDRTKVELGHVVPARISEQESDTLVAHIRRCLTALDIRQGLTHSEVILAADGPVLVETHLRQAGDQIIELVEAATGIDLTELLLQQIVGVDLAQSAEVSARRVSPSYQAAGAIRYLAKDVVGTLDRLEGLAGVSDIDGVDSAEQLLADGSPLEGLRSSYSRIASVRVHADDADSAVKLADEALGQLSVRAVLDA
jgi:biotin carboxylase